jgi:hypothetical protein
MKNLYNFFEFINEEYVYPILEKGFILNKGQSIIAYLIALDNVEKKINISKKKYGKNAYNIFKMVFPEYANTDWDTAIKKISEKIEINYGVLNRAAKKMVDKFLSKKEKDSEIFYFDEIFNMDLDSLVDTAKKYISNINDPIFTGKFEHEKINLPQIFNFLIPIKEKNIRSGDNFNLFKYPNVEDDRLSSIKKMESPYNIQQCSLMIKNGLYSMQLDLSDIDLVLYPKSSSKILDLFGKEVENFIETQRNKLGKKSKPIEVIGDSFTKLTWKDVEIDYDSLERAGDQEFSIKFLYKIERIKNQNPDREFKFSDHLVRIRERYLIGRFMEIPENKINRIRSGSNILIIDDFTTGGNTRKQMKKLVKEKNPEAVVKSLNIFEIKSNIPEKVN